MQNIFLAVIIYPAASAPSTPSSSSRSKSSDDRRDDSRHAYERTRTNGTKSDGYFQVIPIVKKP